jgi:hypothetical protein
VQPLDDSEDLATPLRREEPFDFDSSQADFLPLIDLDRVVNDPYKIQVDTDLLEYEAAMANYIRNSESYSAHPEFETYYNMTKEAAWALLDEVINPLDWYLQLKHLLDGELFMTVREKTVMEHAYIAAAEILSQLNCPQTAVPLSGVFLTDTSARYDVPVVIDTSASFSITPFEEDFVSPLETTDTDTMHGLADLVLVKCVGWVEWTIRDAGNQIAIIRTEAYYVPQAKIRLLSPQTYFGFHNGGHGTFNQYEISIFTPDDVKITFPYTVGGRLPMMFMDQGRAYAGLSGFQCMVLNHTDVMEETKTLLNDQNVNLSPVAKELLLWHYRLAHAGLGWVQDLMHSKKNEVGNHSTPPSIPTKSTKTCSQETTGLKCAGCLLLKQHQKFPGSQTVSNKPEREMTIRRDVQRPGEEVSLDQYVCRTPGRLASTFGKEKPSEQYHGGTIFVDHYLAYIHLVNQVSLRIGETIIGKRAFERFAARHGALIKQYRGDNHPFSTQEFLDELELCEQDITYRGVGAHFQNGVAEQALQTVTSWARAMMMHQLLHWPEQFDPALWPFALEHAVFIWNNTCRDTDQD